MKWLLVAVLVVDAVLGNEYFSAQPILYGVLGILVLAVFAAFLALQTAKGLAFFRLAKEARVDIRKVVWPSRQETTQTTL
ncbi:preprotein translocase subunit SecE, partial [Pseudomonas aeruginosa]|uniref:preprotein translocase subunit SecE n=1 Tax=Pseudomonas aeruginosa TaxID=287 RepID=UPI003CC685E4